MIIYVATVVCDDTFTHRVVIKAQTLPEAEQAAAAYATMYPATFTRTVDTQPATDDELTFFAANGITV